MTTSMQVTQHATIRLSPPRSLWAQVWSRLLRDPRGVLGLALVTLFTVIAVFGPPLAPNNPRRLDYTREYTPPFWQAQSIVKLSPDPAYPLGTDSQGRDVLSRALYGTRTSMLIGWLTVLFTLLIGLPIGLLSGYRGGWVDNALDAAGRCVLRAADHHVLHPGRHGVARDAVWPPAERAGDARVGFLHRGLGGRGPADTRFDADTAGGTVRGCGPGGRNPHRPLADPAHPAQYPRSNPGVGDGHPAQYPDYGGHPGLPAHRHQPADRSGCLLHVELGRHVSGRAREPAQRAVGADCACRVSRARQYRVHFSGRQPARRGSIQGQKIAHRSCATEPPTHLPPANASPRCTATRGNGTRHPGTRPPGPRSPGAARGSRSPRGSSRSSRCPAPPQSESHSCPIPRR